MYTPLRRVCRVRCVPYEVMWSGDVVCGVIAMGVWDEYLGGVLHVLLSLVSSSDRQALRSMVYVRCGSLHPMP